jgi:D-xylulose reductase
MAVAKALGASRVVAVDIVESRLDFAKEYAATDIWKPIAPEKDEARIVYSARNAKAMREKLGLGEGSTTGVDLVVDASGAEPSIQTALSLAKAGGTFVQVGMGNPNVTIDVSLLISKQLTYKGSFRYGVSWTSRCKRMIAD